MDLHMPDLDGVQATHQLLAAHPHVTVLVLTMYDDDEMLRAALTAGARGYLLKGASHSDIAQALRSIVNGGAVFGTGVADQVLDQLARRAAPNHFPQLTPRELEILTLLGAGLRQPRHRPSALPQPKNCSQPRDQHCRQTGLTRPSPSNRRRPRSRT